MFSNTMKSQTKKPSLLSLVFTHFISSWFFCWVNHKMWCGRIFKKKRKKGNYVLEHRNPSNIKHISFRLLISLLVFGPIFIDWIDCWISNGFNPRTNISCWLSHEILTGSHFAHIFENIYDVSSNWKNK